MKRLAEIVFLPWLAAAGLAAAALAYFTMPRWIWPVGFGLVVWRKHWLRRDEPCDVRRADP